MAAHARVSGWSGFDGVTVRNRCRVLVVSHPCDGLGCCVGFAFNPGVRPSLHLSGEPGFSGIVGVGVGFGGLCLCAICCCDGAGFSGAAVFCDFVGLLDVAAVDVGLCGFAAAKAAGSSARHGVGVWDIVRVVDIQKRGRGGMCSVSARNAFHVAHVECGVVGVDDRGLAASQNRVGVRQVAGHSCGPWGFALNAGELQLENAMSIDTETARRVAKLARIKVEDADLPALADDFNRILGFVEQLNEVDVEGVEPMTSVTPMRLKRRVDEVTDGGQQDKVLANAPDAREGFFAVPKVVE